MRRHVWQYAHLSRLQQSRVEQVAANMQANRRWTGGAGFEVTDEMRIAIAGQAALLTLGLEEPYHFPFVSDIIIYPKPFFLSKEQATSWSTDPLFGGATTPRLGEASHDGLVSLAWSAITNPFNNDGSYTCVVLHELAHHLDGLDGDISGAPPIGDKDLANDWYRVTELDYLELVGRAMREEATLLDHYGASNRAEFFAVATECFFNFPHDVREQHSHLYDVLARYFRQNPADYLPRQAQPQLPKPANHSVQLQTRVRQEVARDPFALGLVQFNNHEFKAAADSFTQAIKLDPSDGEAYTERAWALLNLREYNAVLSDAQQALNLDPDEEEVDALLLRGAALVMTGQLDEGIVDLRIAMTAADSPTAHAYLGYAYGEQGALKKAIHHLSIAIAAHPYDPLNYEWRSEIYRRLNELDLAALDTERQRRLLPKK